MHTVELYLNEDEYERLTVLQSYLLARSKEFSPTLENLTAVPLDLIVMLGVFDGLIDLSCLKDKEKTAEMKEYISRMEDEYVWTG